MDTKNVFLNRFLDEEINIQVPAGLSVPPNSCLKLKKCIYGLKQSPWVWYAALEIFFKSESFEPSAANPCLFISTILGWEFYIHVNVDDMIVISHNVDQFKKLISAKFKMDDLGGATHLLGLNLKRLDLKHIFLSQELYTCKILEDYNLLECGTTTTPMVPAIKLIKATENHHKEFTKLNINYWREWVYWATWQSALDLT